MGMLNLPPGFRFHPTDEEIVMEYLVKRISNPNFTTNVMGDIDLNKWEPRDLPSRAKMGEKEWYFFCQKDKKYPTGTRTNRATKEGYWKATGKDKEIYSLLLGKVRVKIGMKKTLVFYMGRAPKGEKTNWVMHEFRLEGNSKIISELKTSQKDEWAVCRVHEKKSTSKKNQAEESNISNQYGDQLDFVDSFIDPSFFNSNNLTSSSASTGIEILENSHPSIIPTPNYSRMMMNQHNFIHPSNFSNVNSIHVGLQNQPWMNNHGYANLGLLHQGTSMTNSMVLPKNDIGIYQTFNNIHG